MIALMALGVDLGGSSVKIVSLLEASSPLNVRLLARIPHGARGIEEIVELLLGVTPRTEEPVGLSVAGLVRGGVVVRSGNLALADAPLRERLAERGVRLAAFISDAHAVGRAALVEESRERVLIALALGTGVGGSLIEDGKIVRDEGLGHGTDTLRDAERPCAVGHPRCLEAHVGAAALARRGGAPSVEELDRRAEAGDLDARRVLHEAGALVGRALARPSARLVLSGGVASSRALLEGAREAFPGPVVLSRFGALAAAAGAALATRP